MIDPQRLPARPSVLPTVDVCVSVPDKVNTSL
jgi:hypothetical protein